VLRLGNQVLLNAKANRQLGGRPFTEKRSVLSASPVTLTSEVGRADCWTAAAIAERSKRLADLAVRYWRYDADGDHGNDASREGRDGNAESS
jgi:hypothetical protein